MTAMTTLRPGAACLPALLVAASLSAADEAFKQRDKTLRRYLKPDLVIIDDMGLKQLPQQ